MHVAQGHRATVHWALRQEQTFARKTFNAGTPTEEKGLWGDDVVYVCVLEREFIYTMHSYKCMHMTPETGTGGNCD